MIAALALWASLAQAGDAPLLPDTRTRQEEVSTCFGPTKPDDANGVPTTEVFGPGCWSPTVDCIQAANQKRTARVELESCKFKLQQAELESSGAMSFGQMAILLGLGFVAGSVITYKMVK